MRPVIVTVALLLFVAGCSRGEDRSPAPGGVIEPGTRVELRSAVDLASPAAAGSLYPHLAVAADGPVVMSWLQPVAGGHELKFATWQGSSWSAARTAAAGHDWFVNWADFPSVVPGADGRLSAHWLQKIPGSVYSYDVRIAQSEDSGASWSPSLSPHDDGTATEHGFVTLMPRREGLLAVWLDGRNTAGGHDHEAGAGGAMTLRSASIVDGRRVTGSDLEIDARVCDCCQTDAAMTADGPVVVYRDRSAREVRDIALVRLGAEGWSEPVPVHEDRWSIDACPVNGPAVTARGRTVAVAWFTAPDGPRIRLAFSADAGRRFAPPLEVAAGRNAGRVDVVLLDESQAVVSWLADGAQGAEIRAQLWTRDGAVGPPLTVARSSVERASGFPRMALAGDTLLFAWTEASASPKVRTAVVRLY